MLILNLINNIFIPDGFFHVNKVKPLYRRLPLNLYLLIATIYSVQTDVCIGTTAEALGCNAGFSVEITYVSQAGFNVKRFVPVGCVDDYLERLVLFRGGKRIYFPMT